MAVYYLDTSALVKRYVEEPGSIWTTALTDPSAKHDLYTGRLTGPEMIAALFRKARVGQITVADAGQATKLFEGDWQQRYQIIELDGSIGNRTMSLASQYPLRGYDAVHLATALEVNARYQTKLLPPLTFVSADLGQVRVAAALGLPTENPDQH